MEKQFGIVPLTQGWRIVSLHGLGDVLESGVTIGDHSTRTEAIDKVNEYVLSHLAIWPEDTVTISSEARHHD